MQTTYDPRDPWLRTVDLLVLTSHEHLDRPAVEYVQRSARDSDPRATGKSYPEGPGTALVSVVERLNHSTAVVDWRDSTAGCCAGQTWRVGVAPRNGRCALSGAAIQRGDAVYRPRPTKQFRANAASMILASKMEDAVPCNEP